MRATRILHTMLRVADLDRSLTFYTKTLGMELFRCEDYPDGKFTLAFVGYADESSSPAIELTYNWGEHRYERGNAYGHIALSVDDIYSECRRLESAGAHIIRQPGPMTSTSPQRTTGEIIAFIEDPDGYRIELVQTPSRLNHSMESNANTGEC